MGLLDDLKQQADSLRERQQLTQAEFNQNLLRVHTKLQEELRYWLDMFDSLNIIKPVVPRTQPAPAAHATVKDAGNPAKGVFDNIESRLTH